MNTEAQLNVSLHIPQPRFGDPWHPRSENLHTHDPKELTRDLKLSTEWQVVDRRIPLYANHKTILQKVASLFGAHF